MDSISSPNLSVCLGLETPLLLYSLPGIYALRLARERGKKIDEKVHEIDNRLTKWDIMTGRLM